MTLPADLSPGQHQLRVDLRNLDGSEMEGAVEYGEDSIVLQVPGLKVPTLAIASPESGTILPPGVLFSMDLDLTNFELVWGG